MERFVVMTKARLFPLRNGGEYGAELYQAAASFQAVTSQRGRFVALRVTWEWHLCDIFVVSFWEFLNECGDFETYICGFFLFEENVSCY